MTDLSDHTKTLNDLLLIRASEWSQQDLETIVEALREQRARWSQEQSAGSRARVTAKQIEIGKPIKKSLAQAIKGLKL
jgi:hypothetical protein